MLGVQGLGVDRLVRTGRGLDDLGDLRGTTRTQAQGDVSGRADLERDVGVGPVPAVARALTPRVDVRTAAGEGVERLTAEAGRLERDPERGVEQVVLARQHVAGRELEAAAVGTHHRAGAVGEERHEREPRHLGGRHRFVDELEVHG